MYTFASLTVLRSMMKNLAKDIAEGRCAERRSKGEDTTGCEVEE